MCHKLTNKSMICVKSIRLLLLLFLILGKSSSEAHDIQRHNIQIVTGDDGNETKKIIGNLSKIFPSAKVVTNPKHYTKINNAIVITIGPSALRSVLTQGAGGIVISAFISSQMYHTIIEEIPKSHSPVITAIYAEPAPAVQLQLISIMYKKQVSVVVILSKKSSYLKPILQQAASRIFIPLHIEDYAETENINRALNRIKNYQVILATPDSTVYSSENVRNILLTTYRRNQPIIGFSAGLVKIGAIASVYSDIDDINAQVGEVVNAFKISGKLPEPQFPKYYSVVVNENVARSLNLIVDDAVKKFSKKPIMRNP